MEIRNSFVARNVGRPVSDGRLDELRETFRSVMRKGRTTSAKT